jgi:general secretion pathway protein G
MRNGERGFTLVELLVVLAIVATLLTLALARGGPALEASREAVLRENLRVTRDVIAKFYADTGRYPDSLAELVERRYLTGVPHDPVADSSDAWTIVPPPAEARGQIGDIRSSAPGSARDGRPYADL